MNVTNEKKVKSNDIYRKRSACSRCARASSSSDAKLWARLSAAAAASRSSAFSLSWLSSWHACSASDCCSFLLAWKQQQTEKELSFNVNEMRDVYFGEGEFHTQKMEWNKKSFTSHTQSSFFKFRIKVEFL